MYSYIIIWYTYRDYILLSDLLFLLCDVWRFTPVVVLYLCVIIRIHAAHVCTVSIIYCAGTPACGITFAYKISHHHHRSQTSEGGERGWRTAVNSSFISFCSVSFCIFTTASTLLSFLFMLSTVFILNRVRIFYLFFFHVPVLLLISVYGFHAASSTQEMKFNTFTAAVSLVRQKFNSALSFFF
jgi:hypothetical protein